MTDGNDDWSASRRDRALRDRAARVSTRVCMESRTGETAGGFAVPWLSNRQHLALGDSKSPGHQEQRVADQLRWTHPSAPRWSTATDNTLSAAERSGASCLQG